MPNYRRAHGPGGTFFFTVVTWNRRPLFAEEKARALLRTAIETTRERRPFTIDAVCLLPDHLHAIWTLPDGDRDFSTRWAQIKGRFSHDWLAWVRSGDGGASPARQSGESTGRAGLAPPNKVQAAHAAGSAHVFSRPAKGEVKVWQKRFWEHQIRDDEDFRRHVEYIHYNPVKHGHATRPAEWPWSSFHRHVAEGKYDEAWGATEPTDLRGHE